MNEIVEKIHSLGFSEYGVCKYEDKACLLVFMDYGYYCESNPDNFQISPYYFASNKCYFAAKELCEYIIAQGYDAVVDNRMIYDGVLEACGARRGDNNLFYIGSSGSLFCVHVILTDAELEERAIGTRECDHCGRCIAACPMGALMGDGINAELCLRHRMDKLGDEVCRGKITRLLGCDECQRVCHLNDVREQSATFDEFNKEKIIAGDISGISQLVGSNMARKSRLQFQGIAIAAGEGELLEQIKSAQIIDSLEDLRKWAIEQIETKGTNAVIVDK